MHGDSFMKLYQAGASAIHATAVCMRSCRNVQDFSDFRAWLALQTDQAVPDDELKEFASDGTFPLFGACITL